MLPFFALVFLVVNAIIKKELSSTSFILYIVHILGTLDLIDVDLFLCTVAQLFWSNLDTIFNF